MKNGAATIENSKEDPQKIKIQNYHKIQEFHTMEYYSTIKNSIFFFLAICDNMDRLQGIMQEY